MDRSGAHDNRNMRKCTFVSSPIILPILVIERVFTCLSSFERHFSPSHSPQGRQRLLLGWRHREVRVGTGGTDESYASNLAHAYWQQRRALHQHHRDDPIRSSWLHVFDQSLFMIRAFNTGMIV